jgi:hypothetical protein
MIATNASILANICRDASEKSANVSVRTQFVNSAREITSITAALITDVKRFDQTQSANDYNECTEQAKKLRSAVEDLQKYLDNPDFGPIPAKISPEGRKAQEPLIRSAKQMLDSSSEMIE